MNTYDYTDNNRLLSPNNYMYTPFKGQSFIEAYLKNRKKNIARFKAQETPYDVNEIDSYIVNSSDQLLKTNTNAAIYEKISNINYFKKSNTIITENLLLHLISKKLTRSKDVSLKKWIDFLVQRFETSKKIFEFYDLNLPRKKIGQFENIRNYWLFSILLTLHYSFTNNIKYLNTNLKVNDTLCSLDDEYFKNIPKKGLVLVLSNEVLNIQKIYNKT